MQRVRLISVHAALVAILAALAVVAGCRDGEGSSRERPPVRTALKSEFTGAYPEESPESGRVRHYELTASPSGVEIADGHELEVWAYNGQVPGPVLRARLGETVRIKLKNELPQPTTIHWHGVRVPNAMDGVPGVTQPPVAPGEEFVYEFTPKDAGTFWFHPHVRGAEQVERGLFGALVVEDAREYPYDQDVVWILDDWRLTGDGQIDPRFVTRRDLAHDGRWGNVVTVNGSVREELVVKAGQRIRLRLINAANGRVFAPDFAGLDARVIAVDGMYTSRPLPPEDFELAPGNRLDLDIAVRPEHAGKTLVISDRFTRRPIRLATLRVEPGDGEVAEFAPPRNDDVPDWERGLEAPVELEYSLNARRGGEHGIEWTLNDAVYGEHEVEVLEGGEWARLRFTNDSPRLHPMHIHGQFFKVLARDGVAVDEPFFRDTILVYPRETVDVGLVPLDWGYWALHCHILEHAEAGMMTVVRVDGDE